MKIRFTKKFIFIGIAYLTICAIVSYLWDSIFAINLAFSSSMVVGILTIIGGFYLAYGLIESDKIEREKARETAQALKEIERKKQLIIILTKFRNSLLPWIFDLACILSGRFFNYNEGLIRSGKYQEDVPELEDVFGIGSHDSQGKRLRGTEQANAINLEVIERPQTPQTLYGTLQYGLRSLESIERQLDEFPSLIEQVEPEVAKIVHLSNDILSLIKRLKDWEKIHTGPFDKIGTDMISNLRSVGRSSLNIVLAIEANIQKLYSETQN